MSAGGYNFGSIRDFQRSRDAVVRVEQMVERRGVPFDEVPKRLFQVILDEALPGTDDPNTPASALATFQSGLKDSDALGPGLSRRIYNRSAADYSAGDYAVVAEFEDEEPGRFFVLPGGSGGGAAGSGCCGCTCVAEGDILVEGIETVSQWVVAFTVDIADSEGQTYGTIYLTAGTYYVVWDEGLGYWTLDVTDFMTAKYLDGSDATADVVDFAGELRFEHNNGGFTLFSIILAGTVPDPGA